MEACLAVDVGGTKLAVGIVSSDGRVLGRARAVTPRTEDPDDLFESLARVVREALDTSASETTAGRPRLAACGVGCGGPMSIPDGTVSPLNIPAWRDFPLVCRLEELTGLEVHIDNDAKALALAEGWLGAAREASDFVAMVVSTGVGGGLVLEGRLLDGRTGNAGHIGHVVVEPEGHLCACGARGCLEAEASGTAIEASTGEPPSRAAPAVVARTGTLVGRAVASVANLLDLELAVVGGSVALGFGAPFFAAANEETRRRARLSFSARARVLPAGLSDLGPLVGAAAVAWRGLGRELLARP